MIKHIEIEDVEELILMALKEDVGDGDVTSEAIFDKGHVSEAVIVAKEDGIFCGSDMIGHVYSYVDAAIEVSLRADEAGPVSGGDRLAFIKGPTAGILSGERIVLNFLQRMCGIATRTSRMAALLQGSGIEILDTRKTLPGFRMLDKYAVRAGGGANHRMGLYDMVMIKDNHIKAAGSIARAVEKVRGSYGTRFLVEVETTNVHEVRQAVEAGADIIMLDNMELEVMTEAVSIIQGRARVEISGNVDEDRIQSLRETGVDYISIGALTHSVRAFDLSMKFV